MIAGSAALGYRRSAGLQVHGRGSDYRVQVHGHAPACVDHHQLARQRKRPPSSPLEVALDILADGRVEMAAMPCRRPLRVPSYEHVDGSRAEHLQRIEWPLPEQASELGVGRVRIERSLDDA